MQDFLGRLPTKKNLDFFSFLIYLLIMVEICTQIKFKGRKFNSFKRYSTMLINGILRSLAAASEEFLIVPAIEPVASTLVKIRSLLN